MIQPDHTVPEFAEPITALATDPRLPPDELKRRFQAPADELREAHNALAGVVKGITDTTYPSTVTREMLAPAVRAELDAKAAQTALTAEVSERQRANAALAAAVAPKCEAYTGSYTGDGAADRVIDLAFAPKAVLILANNGLFALKTSNFTAVQRTDLTLYTRAPEAKGFHIGMSEHDSRYTSFSTNTTGVNYEYIAFKAG